MASSRTRAHAARISCTLRLFAQLSIARRHSRTAIDAGYHTDRERQFDFARPWGLTFAKHISILIPNLSIGRSEP
jgi:hypothetical protein